MHVLDLETKAWSHPTISLPDGKALPGIFSLSMTRIGKKLYLFGGRTGLFETTGDLYRYDPETQEIERIVAKNAPKPRQGHSAVAYEDKIVVYGGNDGSTSWLADVHIYDTTTNVWDQVTSAPVSSEGHKAVVVGNKMYVFGGYNGEKNWLDEIKVLDLDNPNGKWLTLSTRLPSPRAYLSASAIGHLIYIFGGISKSIYLQDTLLFDASTESWVEGPVLGEEVEARTGHCTVAYKSKVVLFGGSKTWKQRYNDVRVLETMPPEQEAAKPEQGGLLDTIDNLVKSINLFISGANSTLSEEEQRSVQESETNLRELLSGDDLFEQFADVPQQIINCQDIQNKYNTILDIKNGISVLSVNISTVIGQVESIKKQYDEVRDGLLRDSTWLNTELRGLRKLQDDEQYAHELSERNKQALQNAQHNLNEKKLVLRNLQSTLSAKNQTITALEREKNSLDEGLKRKQRLLDDRNSILEQDTLNEQNILLDINNLNAELARLNIEIEYRVGNITRITEQINSIANKEHELNKAIKPQLDAEKKRNEYLASLNAYNDELHHLVDVIKSLEPTDELEEEIKKPCTAADNDLLSKTESLIKKARDGLREQRTTLEQQLAALQSELKQLRDQTTLHAEKKETLHAEHRGIEMRLKIKNKERLETEREVARMKEVLRTKAETYGAEKIGFERDVGDVKALQDTVAELTKDLAAKQSESEAHHLFERDLSDQIHRKKAELTKKQQELQESLNYATQLDDQLAALRKQIKATEAEYNVSSREIKDARNKLLQAQDEARAIFCKALEDENEQLRQRIEELEGQIRNLENPQVESEEQAQDQQTEEQN
jgi:chromosome segregation ATPase